ncbi:hypothetical protein [Acinetobacter modestus]|uniref:hypothetical protein n=1 Tax=Acinetobacter modestus TaxID=1776740 RepID=UPI003018B634
MSLAKFSAKITYTSDAGAFYQSTWAQGPNNPNANNVLVDLIDHLVWMAVIADKENEVKEAFEKGFADGVKRKNELNNSKAG